MGLFFNLFVETGNNEKDNKELKQYFLSKGKIVTKLGPYNLNVESLYNNFGITVSVKETGWTGLEGPNEKEIATQVGYQFYELLKDAPKFRYAMVGVEAGEWVDFQNIQDVNFDGYIRDHGLVLNDELSSISKTPLTTFKKGYSWIPYLGEENKTK
jgi:hypothetical protein